MKPTDPEERMAELAEEARSLAEEARGILDSLRETDRVAAENLENFEWPED